MALKSPMMPSPTGTSLSSTFSPYTDSPSSPPFHSSFARPEKRSSAPVGDTLAPPTSPYPQQIEPSPVDSNGTESTDIEEGEQETADESSSAPASDGGLRSPEFGNISPQSTSSERAVRIDTHVTALSRSDSPEDGPQSVIHAPEGYQKFEDTKPQADSSAGRAEHTEVSHSLESPSTPEAIPRSPDTLTNLSVETTIADLAMVIDRGTPQALTRVDLEQEDKRKAKRKSVLHDIPEGTFKDDQDDQDDQSKTPSHSRNSSLDLAQTTLEHVEDEFDALRSALSECWTLCNTLANLSSSYRQRTFQFAGQQQVQEYAWRTCWRLCQELYNSRDQYDATQVMSTLELCREFCQALFDARQKIDEDADSVLRVSFELNNHLYNTHDPSLPEAFNERTLDFYITLCHRLMKQRTSLPQETDALLRACWSLAEMLFNMRQSNREGKKPDEELLGSAVQACWELCDLFREGWTQIRPERGTPRPSQMGFGSVSSLRSSSSRSDHRSQSSLSSRHHVAPLSLPPETPTTVFDDTTSATSSPDSAPVPNILVLGPANASSSNSLRGDDTPHHDRWTSNASVISYSSSTSASSQHSSSTATAEHEQDQLTRLRYLLLKAGMITGYDRNSGQQLTVHVSKIPRTAFGTLPWQMKVLTYYSKLVLSDKSMLSVHSLPPRRLGAAEAAKSIKWLGDTEQWAWMRDLYRLVFGFGIDEVHRSSGAVQV